MALALALFLQATASSQGTFATFTVIDVPGAAYTFTNGINNAGTIVGSYYDAANIEHAFTRNGQIYQTIDIPGYIGTTCHNSGWTEAATGINNGGQIAGEYVRFNPPVALGICSGSVSAEAFLFANNTPVELNNITGDANVFPNAINDAGEIVGSYQVFVGRIRVTHAFLFEGGTYTTIDPPGASEAWATGINNTGQIVGYYEDNDGNIHGFILSNGTYSLIDFPGAAGSQFVGINNSGGAVGNYFAGDGLWTVFVFDTNSPQRPNAFQSFANFGGVFLTASAINDVGQIVGTDADQNGGYHGFIATVPTNLTITTPGILPTATSGQPYGITLMATGGSGAGYTWCVQSGSQCIQQGPPLPNGFSLSGAGLLASSGAPAAPAQSYAFSVQVTDSAGNTATQPLTLTVTPAQLTITTTSLPNAIYQGQPYSVTLMATGGSGTCCTWSASVDITYPPMNTFCASFGQTCFPPGLVFGADGTIGPDSLTDLVSGVYNLTFTATDSAGDTSMPVTLPLNVFCDPSGLGQRDALTGLYRTYPVTNVGRAALLSYLTTNLQFVPACSSFTQTARSGIFPTSAFLAASDQLPYQSALIRYPLISPATANFGLDSLVTLFNISTAAQGFNFGARRITSGYRDPGTQRRLNPNSPNSRHQFGDAVDLGNNSYAILQKPDSPENGGCSKYPSVYAEWEAMASSAWASGASYVEPMKKSAGCHVHADWRDAAGAYQP